MPSLSSSLSVGQFGITAILLLLTGITEPLRKPGFWCPKCSLTSLPWMPPAVNTRSPPDHRWKPPQPGRMKINTDAGCCNSNLWTLAAVFWNDEGRIILAASKNISGSFEPEIPEVMAVLWSFDLAANHGFNHLEVETDCLSLVQAYRASSLLSPLHMVAHFVSKTGCPSSSLSNPLSPFGPIVRLGHADLHSPSNPVS